MQASIRLSRSLYIFRAGLTAVFLLFAVASASAAPITWNLFGYLQGGALFYGSLVYDQDTETYSEVNIVTTAGIDYPGGVYTHFDPLQSPQPGQLAIFWESLPDNLIGVPGIAFQWYGQLTNAGGVAHLFIGSPIEGRCARFNSAGTCLIRQERTGFGGSAWSQQIGMVIDIKPDSSKNKISLKSNGVIPIAILSTSVAKGDSVDFDAVQIDFTSISFGPDGAPAFHQYGHLLDVDDDGDLDLLVHVAVSQSGLTCHDTRPVLKAVMYSGQAVVGADFADTGECR